MAHVKSASDLERELTTTENWPAGVYGDTISGKSFTEEQSAVLIRTEQRARPVTACGWRKKWNNQTCWTIIDVRPETADDVAIYREALANA